MTERVNVRSFEKIESNIKTPFIVSMPHSGMFIPYEAAMCFTPEHYSSLIMTDWYLDMLYDFLPSIGVTVIKNNIYRFVIDVNKKITEPYFGEFMKCVVPASIPPGVPCSWQLYRREPTPDEIRSRIELFHQPYHNELNSIIANLRKDFNEVYLLDLHSFIGGVASDICLGNCLGKTCPESFVDSFHEKFDECGLSTVKNQVFSGGFITSNYYIPNVVNTLQIEIRASCYIDKGELDQGRPPKLCYDQMVSMQQTLKKIFSEVIYTTK